MKLFFLYSILVLTLTVYPRIDLPHIPSGLSADKFAHTAQFVLFSFLYYKMRKNKSISRKDILIELFFLGTLISVFLEYLQKPIPGRSFCWFDIIANLTGFYLFIILSPFARRG